MKIPLQFTGVLFVVLLIPIWLWNHELFLVLNAWHSPIADKVIGLWTGFGDGMVVTLLVAMLMLFQRRLALAALLALTLSGIITQIIKRSLEMPRPPAIFEDVHVLGHHLYNYSFPSGHSTSCGVMALLALLFLGEKHKKLAWSLFVGFLLAAYGRIYGGVHFPLDMLVGFFIGLATMYWCHQRSQRWNLEAWLQSEWSWKLPGLLVMLAASLLAFTYEVKPSTAQDLAWLLPIVALTTLMQAWQKHLR